MRLFCLLEDSKSFCSVLPCWLSCIFPGLRKARNMKDFSADSFLVESGYGYPQIKDRLQETIEEFTTGTSAPDVFFLCYDTDEADEEEIEQEKSEFEQYFVSQKYEHTHHIVPITRCFETWLLGNKSAYPVSIEGDFMTYHRFYPVNKLDPEKMWKPDDCESSVSIYHVVYLQKMLRARWKKNYSKGSPGVAKNKGYFAGIVKRCEQTDDLQSFRNFIEALDGMRGENNG